MGRTELRDRKIFDKCSFGVREGIKSLVLNIAPLKGLLDFQIEMFREQ